MHRERTPPRTWTAIFRTRGTESDPKLWLWHANLTNISVAYVTRILNDLALLNNTMHTNDGLKLYGYPRQWKLEIDVSPSPPWWNILPTSREEISCFHAFLVVLRTESTPRAVYSVVRFPKLMGLKCWTWGFTRPPVISILQPMARKGPVIVSNKHFHHMLFVSCQACCLIFEEGLCS